MPTVTAAHKEVFELIGREHIEKRFSGDPKYAQLDDHQRFEQLCFEYGVELDEVTSEAMQAERRTGVKPVGLSEEPLYKIDVPANRYDILCVQGIARALRIFLGVEEAPVFNVVRPANPVVLRRTKATAAVRPHVVGAVMRGFRFTPERYASFIDLQDKLHQNVCRRRTLVAIGTHDLDSVDGPFTYDARPQNEIRFVALNEDKERNVQELFHYYEHEKEQSHVREYIDITRGFVENHPVISDSKGRVLSLPPIINGDHSKVHLHTKNVFIECTATDLTKAHIVLNTIVAMFFGYCDSVEVVQVVDADTGAEIEVTPNMAPRLETCTVDYVQQLIGIPNISGLEMQKYLNRMALPTSLRLGSGNGCKGVLEVQVPVTRSDILHPCDIAEDVAIGYGYDNLSRELPPIGTVGRGQPLNNLGDLVRRAVAESGYTEVLTWVLSCEEDSLQRMLRPADQLEGFVRLANWKIQAFTLVRQSLLPGLFKTLRSNKGLTSLRNPTRMFEVGDVCFLAGAPAAATYGVERALDLENGEAALEAAVVPQAVAPEDEAKAAAEDPESAPLPSARNAAQERYLAMDRAQEIGAVNQRYLSAVWCGSDSGFEQIHGLVDRIMQLLGAVHRSEAVADKHQDVYWYEADPDNPTFLPKRGARVIFNGRCVGFMGIVHPQILHNFRIEEDRVASVVELNLQALL